EPPSPAGPAVRCRRSSRRPRRPGRPARRPWRAAGRWPAAGRTLRGRPPVPRRGHRPRGPDRGGAPGLLPDDPACVETTVGGGERVSDPHPDTFRASDAGRDESGRVAAERHGGGEGEYQFVDPAGGEETAEHLRPALEVDLPG